PGAAGRPRRGGPPGRAVPAPARGVGGALAGAVLARLRGGGPAPWVLRPARPVAGPPPAGARRPAGAGRGPPAPPPARPPARPAPDGCPGQSEGPGGQIAAAWPAADGETLLEIHEGWLPGPFERMLVLAATLGGN